MEFIPQQCAAASVGTANDLFGILFQTLLAAHCALSSADRWPKDYGPTALEKGKSNKLWKSEGVTMDQFFQQVLKNMIL